jgi:hypothetical protein
MKRKAAVALAAIAVVVAGCGGGDDSGYTRDDVANALGLHNEHHEVIYERAPGKDCVVLQVLTSSDEIEVAQSDAPDLPTALAVNSTGDAAVMFAGFGDLSQDECVAPAESDLNSLSE